MTVNEANTFAKYYFGTITSPLRTFDVLYQSPGQLSAEFYAASITAFLFTLVYIFLILGGGQPHRPWLNIHEKSYYRYNVFFFAPIMYLGWKLAAGVVHMVSRRIVHIGSFEQLLCVFGFGISIASWTTGIHDIVTGFAGAIHIINQSEYEMALNSPTIWRTLLWI